MTRVILFLSLVAVMATGAPAASKKKKAAPTKTASPAKAAPKSQPILALPHRAVTLTNGLRVYLVQYPSPGVVAYELPVRAGSRNEVEKGKTGFAHFFEHLMFRGTKNQTGKEFGELYARLGAENNAWTWFDMTAYHGVVSREYLPKILAAEADRFLNLQFDEKQFKDEAGAVLGEYNKNVAAPEFQLEEKLHETAFRVHPYGHTTMGYRDDIVAYPTRYQDVWPFFRRYYQPKNVAIVLVGDIDFEKAKGLIDLNFGTWKESPDEPQVVPPEPEQEETRTAEVIVEKPTQTRIAIAYKVPAFTTANVESAALTLLAEAAFSETSDFQKTYRFGKKWVDSVDASPLQMKDPGLWTIQLRLSDAGTSSENEIRKGVEQQMEKLRKQPIPAARLAATKKRFKNGALTRWFDSPSKLCGQIAWYTGFEDDLGVLDRVFQRLDEATPEDLRKFAAKYLTDNRKTVVTLRGKK